jgi:hypothetical protein
VSFAAAQRANSQSSSQTFQVLVDGTVVAIITPPSASYTSLTSGPFTVGAGSHTLTFVGLNPHGGDNTAFIDQVAVNQPALQNVAGIKDPDFSSPGVGLGSPAFQYRPAGSPWTFSGGAGLTGNGSLFTAGNPPAPQGTQVAFLQNTGQVSQSIDLSAGTYAINLSAAQRANSQASRQTFRVLVDGTVVGIFTPSATSYATLTTGPFTVGAGTHTLTIAGLNPNGGDNTAFIDQVVVNVATPPSAPTVQDPDFESPGVGVGTYAFQYRPAGSPWTFTGQAGLAGNGSLFTAGNPAAPEGTQVAFIQGTGKVSQTFNLAPGSYKVSFSAAQRANSQSSSQTIEVLFDGVVVGTFKPAGSSYATLTTSAFNVSGSSTHTLTFQGLNPNGGDNTGFISAVAINSA